MASSPAPIASSPPVTVRRLTRADAPVAGSLHRASYEDRLPWLAGRHDEAGFIRFFADTLIDAGPVWGAFADDRLLGFIALRGDLVDQLFIAPGHQSQGVGSLLLDLAKASAERLTLVVFERNEAAWQFYERRGFVAVEHRDGTCNEEGEPEILYAWQRGPGDCPRERFGDGPALADTLLALVLAGVKTATCWDAREGLKGSAIGGRWAALDGAGAPRALLETVELTTRRFDEVDAGFAFDEGEDDRSLAAWQREHRAYFQRNGHFASDMPLCCERFRLVAAL
ncbi:GNAT family N-acetyltransferase [Glacieibacterium frigidum]|uniref:GNAT family N-acetyltransferase n=1 Tax=Glacieibacterium frigidum TaxID=2593303 RepID=UPI001A9C3C33|nr:GNAT family N-acetyltransferase [Glacieibacterium frigidum]